MSTQKGDAVVVAGISAEAQGDHNILSVRLSAIDQLSRLIRGILG